MQQALPAAFVAERMAGQPTSAPRVNRYLVAGAAMVCAGAMAVHPAAPSIAALPAVHQQSVQLAAWTNPILEEPLALWGKTFTDSFTQVGAIGAAVAADPFPILNQITENQIGHLKVLIGAKAAPGQRRGTGILGAAESVGRSIDDLPVRLQAAAAFLADGNVTEALVEVNTWALRLLEAVAFPLVPVFAIPGAMIDAAGRVFDALVTRGAIADISKGLMAPPLSVAFALANVVDQVIRSAKAGDLGEVFTAVVNAPAIAVGAFFNGYQPMFGYDEAGEPILSPEFFPGVFSAGGTLDALFVQLPKKIAEALAPPVVTPTVTTPPATTATLVTLDVPATADSAAVEAVTAEATSTTEPADSTAAETVIAEEDETTVDTEATPVTDDAIAEADPGAEPEDAATGDEADEAAAGDEADDVSAGDEDEDDTEAPASPSTTTDSDSASNSDADSETGSE
ncbi:MAG TPA: hypothetical protein VIQ11_12860 [Mycobacterium sp.]